VTFNVRAGTYSQSLNPAPVYGLQRSIPLKFQSEMGDSTLVTLGTLQLTCRLYHSKKCHLAWSFYEYAVELQCYFKLHYQRRCNSKHSSYVLAENNVINGRLSFYGTNLVTYYGNIARQNTLVTDWELFPIIRIQY